MVYYKEECDKNVSEGIRDAYWKIYWQLLAAVKVTTEKTGEPLPVELMYRYIDHDCEQDIIRVKKVYLNELGELCYISDEWDGHDYAPDVRFDWDDCFEDEGEGNLWEAEPNLFSLDFIAELYNEVVNYAIPKLENNGQDS